MSDQEELVDELGTSAPMYKMSFFIDYGHETRSITVKYMIRPNQDPLAAKEVDVWLAGVSKPYDSYIGIVHQNISFASWGWRRVSSYRCVEAFRFNTKDDAIKSLVKEYLNDNTKTPKKQEESMKDQKDIPLNLELVKTYSCISTESIKESMHVSHPDHPAGLQHIIGHLYSMHNEKYPSLLWMVRSSDGKFHKSCHTQECAIFDLMEYDATLNKNVETKDIKFISNRSAYWLEVDGVSKEHQLGCVVESFGGWRIAPWTEEQLSAEVFSTKEEAAVALIEHNRLTQNQ